MIGNDIIDLSYARKTSNIHHPRWREKVLTQLEREQIGDFPNIEIALWSFWSLKESAYKVFFKKTGKRLFIPKKFQLTLINLRADFLSAHIESPLGNWHGEVQIASNTIHALVATQKSFLQKIVWQKMFFSHTTFSHQSSEIRNSLCRRLHTYHQFSANELRIESPRHFPQVFLKNKVLPIDVSLSHHHEWGAFAFLQAEH